MHKLVRLNDWSNCDWGSIGTQTLSLWQSLMGFTSFLECDPLAYRSFVNCQWLLQQSHLLFLSPHSLCFGYTGFLFIFAKFNPELKDLTFGLLFAWNSLPLDFAELSPLPYSEVISNITSPEKTSLTIPSNSAFHHSLHSILSPLTLLYFFKALIITWNYINVFVFLFIVHLPPRM